MDYTQIRYELQGRVATVTLNRPERLNAWTPVMAREFRQAMERANDDPQVRAVIITGAGRGFCAGVDMGALEGMTETGKTESAGFEPLDEHARADFQHPMTWLPSIGKPVIAAVNGAAAGLGFALLLFCDLRFASSEAAFVTSFSRRGLVAEHGTSWMLTRLVGHSRAIDLMFSSRKVGAEEAYRIGLADRVVNRDRLLEEAQAYAQDLAESVSPRSLQIMKRQLWDALFVDLATSIEEADREMKLSLQSADFKEGVAHFLEKRPPRFAGYRPSGLAGSRTS
ncbi:enoyl-CoA hydratase [Erythrobacter citreus]|uniref:Enoyl-CoA hydratase n=1 Tax=Qipengyuania citrea TaxID=225971 RepID=A0A6I4U6P2_9SPHN|nr:enoyl-CoA hydratase [Qipengyuania citrea]MDQ0565930.1 enoyl-CoA hydratase/carnithine racemase [Qipengyuania citrea]MXP34298.1 enoyl-CoA hydratase [Qipengyuania citrea]